MVTVLSRALVVGAACFVVGSIVGHLAMVVISREVADHEQRFPLPDDDAVDADDVAGVSV